MNNYSCTIGYLYDVLDRISIVSVFVLFACLAITFATLIDFNDGGLESFRKKFHDSNHPLKKVIIVGLIALALVIFIP